MAARPTTLAVTEDSTIMPNERTSKLARMSSIAKKTPASGALNVAAIPPAAPHATSRRIRGSLMRTTRPRVDPSAEPICTMGPSRPTDPPPPIHRAEARALTAATCGGIRPPLRATAYITSGTPCPRASRAKKCTSGPIQQPRDNRGADHEPAPKAWQARVGGVAGQRVVRMAGQQQSERLDQPAEDDRPGTGPQADEQSEQHQARVRRAQLGGEPGAAVLQRERCHPGGSTEYWRGPGR